jgi:hypothetical protein
MPNSTTNNTMPEILKLDGMGGKQDPQDESPTPLASFFQTLGLIREDEEHKTLQTLALSQDNARLPHESLRSWNKTSTKEIEEEEARPSFHKALSTGTLPHHQQDRWNTNASPATILSPSMLQATRNPAKPPPIAAIGRPPLFNSDSPNSVMNMHQNADGIPSPPPFPKPMQRSNGSRQLLLNVQQSAPIPPSRKPFVEGDADYQSFMRHKSDSALVCPKRTPTTRPFYQVSWGNNNSKEDTAAPKSSKPSYWRSGSS